MLKRGCVVVSTAGKDKGLAMAVLDVAPEGIWIADGRKRLIQQPKRKNRRHLAVTCFTVEESSMVTNRELRRALTEVQGAQNQVT